MRSGNDEARGLYRKFLVERADGSSAHGKRHYGCRYFVLDLDHDQFSSVALKAYAAACREQFPALADDLELVLKGHNPNEERSVMGISAMKTPRSAREVADQIFERDSWYRTPNYVVPILEAWAAELLASRERRKPERRTEQLDEWVISWGSRGHECSGFDSTNRRTHPDHRAKGGGECK